MFKCVIAGGGEGEGSQKYPLIWQGDLFFRHEDLRFFCGFFFSKNSPLGRFPIKIKTKIGYLIIHC